MSKTETSGHTPPQCNSAASPEDNGGKLQQKKSTVKRVIVILITIVLSLGCSLILTHVLTEKPRVLFSRWREPIRTEDLVRAMVASRSSLGYQSSERALLWLTPDPGRALHILPTLGQVEPGRLPAPFAATGKQIFGFLAVSDPGEAIAFYADYDTVGSTYAPLKVRVASARPTTMLGSSGSRTSAIPALLFEMQRRQTGASEFLHYTPVALVLLTAKTTPQGGFSLGLNVFDCRVSESETRVDFRLVRRLAVVEHGHLPTPGGFLRTWMPSYTCVLLDEETAAETLSRELQGIISRRGRTSAKQSDIIPIASPSETKALLPSVTAFVRDLLACRLRPQGKGPSVTADEPFGQTFHAGSATRYLLSDVGRMRMPMIVGGVDATGWIQFLTIECMFFCVFLLFATLLPAAWVNRRMLDCFVGYFGASQVLLGFFGTLLGITLALDAGRNLSSSDEMVRLMANNRVFGALAVAFFTSIIGLAADRISELCRILLHDAREKDEGPLPVKLVKE